MTELEILQAHTRAVFGEDAYADAYPSQYEFRHCFVAIAVDGRHSSFAVIGGSKEDACRKLSSMLVVLANAGWKP